MENENSQGKNSKDARLAIMELANMISVPMSLNAIVKLKVADAIWESGSNSPLSAAEIIDKIGGGDCENLQRMLRILTSYNVFHEHIVDAISERRYSLTEVGKTLAADENGLSHGPYVLQHHQDALMNTWGLVHEAVIDPSTELFVKVNGEPTYKYYGKNPEMTTLMLNAMTGVSTPFMEDMLESYDGFKGINTLVDVGGSVGVCLKMILEKHPTIQQGINFDLPEVVEKAPLIPRVKHIGGDIMKDIPKGDAIFMKWMLLIQTDDECKQIFKSCYNALQEGGKLIVCEPLLPHHIDDSIRTRALLGADIFMMTIYRTKGKVRPEEEYRQIARAAGFTNGLSFYIDPFFTILEFHKK